MLRANLSSVLPPEFREISLLSAGTGIHRNIRILCGVPHPIPSPCNVGKRWSLLVLYASAVPASALMAQCYAAAASTFGPLLEGYFHDPFTENLHRPSPLCASEDHVLLPVTAFLIVKNLNSL